MSQTAPHPDESLQRLLADCVEDHVITPEQAGSITRHAQELTSPGAEPSRRGLAIEALGYTGGVVITVSAFLITNLYWADLPLVARLTTVGAVAVTLVVAGAFVAARDGAGHRLRGVLWAAGVVAAGGFLSILGSESFDLGENGSALLATSGASVGALVLWRLHHHLVQQVAALAATVGLGAAVGVQLFDSELVPPAVGSGVALVWFVAAQRRLLASRNLMLPLAAAVMIVLASATVDSYGGIGLAVGAVAFVLALAVIETDLLLLGVGAVGTFLVLPPAVNKLFPDSTVTPFALLAVGVGLVGMALWTARRSERRGGESRAVSRRCPRHPDAQGAPAVGRDRGEPGRGGGSQDAVLGALPRQRDRSPCCGERAAQGRRPVPGAQRPAHGRVVT